MVETLDFATYSVSFGGEEINNNDFTLSAIWQGDYKFERIAGLNITWYGGQIELLSSTSSGIGVPTVVRLSREDGTNFSLKNFDWSHEGPHEYSIGKYFGEANEELFDISQDDGLGNSNSFTGNELQNILSQNFTNVPHVDFISIARPYPSMPGFEDMVMDGETKFHIYNVEVEVGGVTPLEEAIVEVVEATPLEDAIAETLDFATYSTSSESGITTNAHNLPRIWHGDYKLEDITFSYHSYHNDNSESGLTWWGEQIEIISGNISGWTIVRLSRDDRKKFSLKDFNWYVGNSYNHTYKIVNPDNYEYIVSENGTGMQGLLSGYPDFETIQQNHFTNVSYVDLYSVLESSTDFNYVTKWHIDNIQVELTGTDSDDSWWLLPLESDIIRYESLTWDLTQESDKIYTTSNGYKLEDLTPGCGSGSINFYDYAINISSNDENSWTIVRLSREDRKKFNLISLDSWSSGDHIFKVVGEVGEESFEYIVSQGTIENPPPPPDPEAEQTQLPSNIPYIDFYLTTGDNAFGATSEIRGVIIEPLEEIDDSEWARPDESNAAEIDAVIVERDQAIVERDQAIVERDQAIAERDAALTSLALIKNAIQ